MKTAYIDKILLAEEQAEQIVSKKSEQLSKDREEFLELDKKRYVTELNKLEKKYAEKLQDIVAKIQAEFDNLENEKTNAIAATTKRVVQGVQDGYC